MVVQLSIYVTDSSMCIEHIINPVRHRVRLIKRLKIEGSVKTNRGIRCMKCGINGGVQSAGRLIGNQSCQIDDMFRGY
jgi:hypothetical protein